MSAHIVELMSVDGMKQETTAEACAKEPPNGPVFVHLTFQSHR
jgi:hypothetical protein